MKTYLINLDKNTDRLAFMDAQLKRLRIEYERISGIYGKELTPEQRKKWVSSFRSFAAIGRKMSDGEIGCALSHLSVYREMVKKEIPLALIFEDDVIIDNNIIDVSSFLERSLDSVQKQVATLSDWLAVDKKECPPAFENIEAFDYTDGYVITLAAAKEILRLNSPVVTVADSWSRWRSRGGLKLYGVYPTCVAQDNERFPTDVSQNAMRPPRGIRWLFWKALRIPEVFYDWLVWKITGK